MSENLSDPHYPPPISTPERGTDMSDTKLWAHEEPHWWGPIECDGLFLLFDTSAHVNDGVPTVTPDEAVEHINGCSTCRDLDMRVTIDADGLGTVENVA